MMNEATAKLNYDTACRFMKQEAYLQAIEYFERTGREKRFTPDTLRNMAWCQFRLAEEAIFKGTPSSAQERLKLAERLYREAGKAFLQMRKGKQSVEVQERIDFRVKDCRKRISDIRCYREFIERKEEFQEKLKDKSRKTITQSGALPISAILDIEDNSAS